jgi:hypothetical protein
MARPGQVYVRNLRETMKQLKEFDPKAQKEINKRINTAAATVRDTARAEMPSGNAMRNWGGWRVGQRGSGITDERRDLSWRNPQANIQTKRGGQTRKRGGVYSSYIGVINKSPAGAIFELAGRKSPQSRMAIGLQRSGHGISRKSGTDRPGVFKAYDQKGPQARKDIAQALEDAQKALQAKLNSMQ